MYIDKNGNKFDVTAVVETDNGTLTFDSFTIANYWNDCSFSFKVDKDTVIETISFKFTDGNGEASTTACFRDVYLDGNLNG